MVSTKYFKQSAWFVAQLGATIGLAFLIAFLGLVGLGSIVYANTGDVNVIVTKLGNGSGRVASAPAGIDCGIDCESLYPPDSLVTLTATADHGSNFTGWQGACTGTGSVCAVRVYSTTEITAIFSLNQYLFTVAMAGNGSGSVTSTPTGIDCGNDCAEFYAHGTHVTLTARADSSSTFAGWSGACSGVSPSCSVTIDAAKSVTAIFILNQYTLTVNRSGNGNGRVGSTLSGIDCGNACTAVYPHGTVITLTAHASIPDSNFTGWQDACTGTTNTCIVTMDGPKNVTALFTLQQHNLQVIKVGDGDGRIVSTPIGIDCGSTCSVPYNHGTLVQLTATATINSTFAGWSGACTGAETSCTLPIDRTQSISATFVIKQFALTVSREGNGNGTVTSAAGDIDCGSNCSGLYKYDTQITLTAVAESNSEFVGWQGACSGASTSCTVTIDGAKAAIAGFRLKQYELGVHHSGSGAGAITSVPAGIICGITCTQPIDHGAVVTLTATAATNSTFTGWQGACTGSDPHCRITVDGTKNVTATFTLKAYALIVAKSGSGDGTVTSQPDGISCGITCTQSLPHGTPITLTATATLSSTFTGWQGACTGNDPHCAFTVDDSKHVTATFTLKAYALTVAKSGSGDGTVTSPPDGIKLGAISCGITCTQSLPHGTAITLTATAAISSTFTGWEGACNGVDPLCAITVDNSQSVTATFILKQYTLTVTQTGSGAGQLTDSSLGLACPLTCTLLLDHGTLVTITATAATSSTFTSWSGACSGADALCTIAMDGAKVVTGAFDLKEYELTVVKPGNGVGTVISSPPGMDCGLTCTLRAGYGTLITLTATPAEQSLFAGWQGDCTGAGPLCTLTITAGQTISATFTRKQYPLTVTKTGNGSGWITSIPAAIDCGLTCTTLFDGGTVVTLTATAGEKSIFTGWTGACNGDATCLVALDSTKVITAHFIGEPVVSLAAGITTAPPVASAGQIITYHYQITNTGDLSVTVQALSDPLGALVFRRNRDGAVLAADTDLAPREAASAVSYVRVPRCDNANALHNALTVTGTTSNGLITTAAISLTTPVNNGILPAQPATTNTVYIGCNIQLTAVVNSAAADEIYSMVVIDGPAPAGLFLQGVQEVQPYSDSFTLIEQTNALLRENCAPNGGCRAIRRMIIGEGQQIFIETIDRIITIWQQFLPAVQKR